MTNTTLSSVVGWARRSSLPVLTGLFAMLLVACDIAAPPRKFNHVDITGATYARELALTDHTGKARTLDDFKGKVIVVFFGFTQCPDVCPTTLSELAGVVKQFGPEGERIQVLFVTVDPERDTRELLAAYVPNFNANFLGLFGDPAATEKVTREFKVHVAKVPGRTPGSYTVDHTAGSYVFDKQGRIRLFVRHGKSSDDLVSDLRALLAE